MYNLHNLHPHLLIKIQNKTQKQHPSTILQSSSRSAKLPFIVDESFTGNLASLSYKSVLKTLFK